MEKRIFLILASLSFLFLFSCTDGNLTSDGSIIGVGDIIPDFSVTMSDGSTVTGESLRNGVSCIVFFNTTCPDCQATMPHIQSIYDKYSPQGVRFAVISREDGNAAVSSYWNTNGYTMPYSAQKDRIIYNMFASYSIPRVYIGDLSGRIVACFDDSPLPAVAEISTVLEQHIH